jgi:hypothetical protein
MFEQLISTHAKALSISQVELATLSAFARLSGKSTAQNQPLDRVLHPRPSRQSLKSLPYIFRIDG